MPKKIVKYQKIHPHFLTVHHFVMIIPLIAAFVWMGLLIFTQSEDSAFVSLSPERTSALINGLFVFILGYGLFLLFFFWKAQKWVLMPSKK